MTKTKSDFAGIRNYLLKAVNGRPIRTATAIVFKDGTEWKYVEKMSRRLALAQLP